ncbi:MAG: hypothetical protein IJ131_03535 [Eggerthellaceae bacterium]|nr:hypothetical protein [Eggerthellaceae bacterium]
MPSQDHKSIELDCGIAQQRIVSWLEGELRLPHEDDGYRYSHEGTTCIARTQPLENRTVGTVSIERTALYIEGEADAVAAFMHLFTLRFISAGG